MNGLETIQSNNGTSASEALEAAKPFYLESKKDIEARTANIPANPSVAPTETTETLAEVAQRLGSVSEQA